MRKTAMITGATSGIGDAVARRLFRQGMRLILTGRREDRLRKLQTELAGTDKDRIRILPFDVRNREQTELSVLSLPDGWKDIDLLVNNAGLAAGFDPIQNGNPEDWDRMIDTNIKGVLNVTSAVVPSMIARGSGHIVNVGSIAGSEVYANGNVYCATKHAVHALSEAMRIDLLPHGIRVSEVRPGMVDTEFSQVRFHGDTERARAVYRGVNPLSGDDVAAVVEWISSTPSHVCINDVVMTCTQQANSFYVHRENEQ